MQFQKISRDIQITSFSFQNRAAMPMFAFSSLLEIFSSCHLLSKKCDLTRSQTSQFPFLTLPSFCVLEVLFSFFNISFVLDLCGPSTQMFF